MKFNTRWLITILCTVLVTVNLTAQTRTLIVQIDTLVFQDGTPEKIDLRVRNQGFMNSGEEFDSTQVITLERYPNYIQPLQLHFNSATIEIPIDKNGSFIKLENVYNYKKDTLKIDRLNIYDTKPIDSTFLVKEKYKRAKEKPEGKLFYRKVVKVEESKGVSPPTKIELKLDGIKYQVNIATFLESSELILGHGYKPKKYMVKDPYDENRNLKKGVKKLYYSTTYYKYVWKGDIWLKR